MALSYTQDAGLYNITDNADGTFNFEFANDQFIYDRDANSEISPFDSDIDLIVTDVTDLDAVTNTGTFTLQPLPVESRFGRIKMGNIHGSELIDLAMPMLVEYLNPAGLFVANTDDNCTVVTTADLAITDNLSVPGSSTVTVTNPLALAADLGVGLTAPGTGIDGNIIVSPGLTGVADWLQYDWDSVGVGQFDDDPSAIATFGIYTGNDVNIYKRQIYQ
jgi:MSHA biogenesis protein MshQ